MKHVEELKESHIWEIHIFPHTEKILHRFSQAISIFTPLPVVLLRSSHVQSLHPEYSLIGCAIWCH